ncbi:MAG: molybdopterin-guanine dinucleotide biosynthesis protein B [Burkholderiaceae bacterium]|nr:molybdopterin-guanine dinucleotide biosynthesis protein B [Burkholderiaceae bacterium]
MTKRVLGVVGRSGNGKTTLLEHLLPRLIAQGLRVNIIKHSHHDIELEPAHKDSARLRAAGAAEVLVASPYRMSLVQELRGQPEPTLAQQMARLSPADLTLVEGYKQVAIPKIEVYRPAVGKQPLYPDDDHILAVVSDGSAPSTDRPLDWLDLRQPDQVLEWMVAYATK